MFAEFLISRISLKEQAGPVAAELQALSFVLDSVEGHTFSSEANAAVFDVLDRFIANTLTSIRSEADANLYGPCPQDLLQARPYAMACHGIQISGGDYQCPV